MYILHVSLVIKHQRDKLMRCFWADEWVHISNLTAWMDFSVILSCGLCATCVIKSVWRAPFLLFIERDECMPRAPVTLKRECVYCASQRFHFSRETDPDGWKANVAQTSRIFAPLIWIWFFWKPLCPSEKLILPLRFCDPAAYQHQSWSRKMSWPNMEQSFSVIGKLSRLHLECYQGASQNT